MRSHGHHTGNATRKLTRDPPNCNLCFGSDLDPRPPPSNTKKSSCPKVSNKFRSQRLSLIYCPDLHFCQHRLLNRPPAMTLLSAFFGLLAVAAQAQAAIAPHPCSAYASKVSKLHTCSTASAFCSSYLDGPASFTRTTTKTKTVEPKKATVTSTITSGISTV